MDSKIDGEMRCVGNLLWNLYFNKQRIGNAGRYRCRWKRKAALL